MLSDAYFSATKIKWILDHVPGAREQARRGEVLFGTVDSWLIWKLTGGKVHVTDYTNASRTMLYNIKRLCWDDGAAAGAGHSRWQCCRRCATPARFTAMPISRGCRCPLRASPGTSRPRCSGRPAFAQGEAKNTYGTGCFLLMNTGDHAL